MDGSLADFSIPYYFHVEPTLILGGALGRFTFVVNQGAIALLGPDGNFQDQHIIVPTIYFWDAHYAVSYAPWSFLGASVELATDVQLNHIAGVDFAKFNDIRAVWVAPGAAAPLRRLPHRPDRAHRPVARPGAVRRPRVRRGRARTPCASPGLSIDRAESASLRADARLRSATVSMLTRAAASRRRGAAAPSHAATAVRIARRRASSRSAIELPPGCPPAQANELGIGKPCTMCGNECTRQPALHLRSVSRRPAHRRPLRLHAGCSSRQQGSTDPCGAPLARTSAAATPPAAPT